MLGFDLSDEFSYQITVSKITEPVPELDDMCPWSDELSYELLYKVAVHLRDEEREDKADIS